MRVLYIVDNYPHLSESYIRTEIDYIRSVGIEDRVYARYQASAPYDAGGVVYYGTSLEAAVEDFKPDVIHVHWSNLAVIFLEQLEKIGIPVTVRGHSFEHSDYAVSLLIKSPIIKKIFLFPHFVTSPQEKLVALSACYDPKLYYPAEKDPRLVFRASPGLSTKGLEGFIDIAKQVPNLSFVLALTRSLHDKDTVDRIMAFNERIGHPVVILLNLQHEQVAEISRRARIYLRNFNPGAHPTGMPVSIFEAMATGAIVLTQAGVLQQYLRGPGYVFNSADEAVGLLKKLINCGPETLESKRRLAIETAAQYAAPVVLQKLVLAWKALV